MGQLIYSVWFYLYSSQSKYDQYFQMQPDRTLTMGFRYNFFKFCTKCEISCLLLAICSLFFQSRSHNTDANMQEVFDLFSREWDRMINFVILFLNALYSYGFGKLQSKCSYLYLLFWIKCSVYCNRIHYNVKQVMLVRMSALKTINCNLFCWNSGQLKCKVCCV